MTASVKTASKISNQSTAHAGAMRMAPRPHGPAVTAALRGGDRDTWVTSLRPADGIVGARAPVVALAAGLKPAAGASSSSSAAAACSRAFAPTPTSSDVGVTASERLMQAIEVGGYEDQSAAAKAAMVWSAIQESEYASLPKWTGLEALSLVLRALDPLRRFTQRAHMNVTMDRQKDVLPVGRGKPIHTYGSVAPVRLVVDPSSPYTGLLGSGAEHGFVRLSLAKKPGDDGCVPGMAVKLMVDGQPSVNFVAMYSLDGQPSNDFFANDFSNTVPKPEGAVLKLLERLFTVATRDATKVSVAHLAGVDARGQAVAQPNAPERLVLRPGRELPQFSSQLHDVRDDFAKIEPGSTLYEVFAVRSDGGETRIGALQTTDRFVASRFGDESLFFNHQRFRGE